MGIRGCDRSFVGFFLVFVGREVGSEAGESRHVYVHEYVCTHT